MINENGLQKRRFAATSFLKRLTNNKSYIKIQQNRLSKRPMKKIGQILGNPNEVYRVFINKLFDNFR